MRRPPLPAAARDPDRGFTLIELLVTIAIMGIIAAIAYPSYRDSVRKSRRAEAFSALNAVQQAQERWRSNNPSYTATLANTAASGDPPNGLGLPATTAGGYYGISVSGTSAAGYTALATAATGTSQADDGNCVRLRIRAAGGNLFYGSAAASGDFSEAADNPCWVR